MASKSFGAQIARLNHLLAGKGGMAGEVVDLRKDVEAGFVANEARSGFPEVNAIDTAAVAAAGGAMTLVGTGLLQGQTFDAAAITSGTGTVTVTALKPGDSGISVVVAAPSSTLLISYANKVLTIRPAAAGSTDDAVATAINADASAARGVVRAASSSAGTMNAAVASIPLTGGVGEYASNVVSVGGLESLPANTTGTAGAAAWSDTGINVTVPALTGRAAGDTVAVRVISNGVRTQNLSMVVGT